MVRGEEREDNGGEAGLLFIGKNYMWVMHHQTNTAFETTVSPPLSSKYSDFPDLPSTTLIPNAVIYALASLCLSVLWDRCVQLMQILLELGLNLHPMCANSSWKIMSMLINFTCEGVEWLVLAVYKPALERRVVLMEEIVLHIVRVFISSTAWLAWGSPVFQEDKEPP